MYDYAEVGSRYDDEREIRPTMQINNNIPINIAQAYGIKPKATVNPIAKLSGNVQSHALKPTSNVPKVGSIEGISNLPGISRPRLIDRLVAATVNQPIAFNGAATSAPIEGAAYQLYNSAADKIEVATSINVGRSIDVKG